ncbi:hypothetical protein FGO68_gene16512 [Halteria grandinella]|uniref:Uncharacterized protein n=1 Tax=Halteria grandinella TaxID=5974 RepID=A0A8J8SXM9_HALGN|nr:hypothetical protein FGO68_gene16512 [Halteria grandinella]
MQAKFGIKAERPGTAAAAENAVTEQVSGEKKKKKKKKKKANTAVANAVNADMFFEGGSPLPEWVEDTEFEGGSDEEIGGADEAAESIKQKSKKKKKKKKKSVKSKRSRSKSLTKKKTKKKKKKISNSTRFPSLTLPTRLRNKRQKNHLIQLRLLPSKRKRPRASGQRREASARGGGTVLAVHIGNRKMMPHWRMILTTTLGLILRLRKYPLVKRGSLCPLPLIERTCSSQSLSMRKNA